MDGMFRRFILALIGLNITIGIVGMASAERYRGYELPAYVVEHVEGDIEVRRYAPQLLAEVQVAGNRNGAIGRGFRLLAGYIFGGNATGEKIAMTVPVTQIETAPDTWSVTFMMPSQEARETLPDPENAAIRFREADGDRQVALRFSGLATAGKIARQEQRLRAYATQNGLETEGALRVSYYDDPFTLPWLRRNEVALSLR